MLKDEIIEFEKLSGENAELTPISRIGGFLDGYQKAMEKQQWIPCSERMPSAQKKGHWIDGSCSVCGCDEPMFIEDWNVEHCKTPFCPNCGAYMRNYED